MEMLKSDRCDLIRVLVKASCGLCVGRSSDSTSNLLGESISS